MQNTAVFSSYCFPTTNCSVVLYGSTELINKPEAGGLEFLREDLNVIYWPTFLTET